MNSRAVGCGGVAFVSACSPVEPARDVADDERTITTGDLRAIE
jgi:hypothetical protein